MWWIVALIVLLLVAVALVSELRVKLAYFREGEDDEVDIDIKALYGLVRFRYKVPTIQLKPKLDGFRMKIKQQHTGQEPVVEFTREEIETFIRKVRKLLAHMKEYKDWLAGTLHHLHLTEMRWETRFGNGDAPETGLSAGVLWSLKSAVVGYASRWVTLAERPSLRVTPVFGRPCFRTEARLCMHTPIYRLVVVGAMLMYRVVRKRGGWQVWFRTLLLPRIRKGRAA